MFIRCPDCHEAVEVEGSGAFDSIQCPTCGSSFDLLQENTANLATPRSIGHFELLDELGSGAFGTVWKARDTQLDRLVAIKVPRIAQSDSNRGEMFLREARAAAQLRHPHIVAVHEVGREDGTLYIVSDFVQGVTLANRLAASPMSPREAAELLAQVADGLHHAHEAGVIHRDLKPQNIMIDGTGQPLLMDFGLAKRDVGEITLTAAGKILGTPAYMSPEQARGEGHDADRRADIYSLGVILFELLTRERPFRGNVQMLVLQVMHEEPPSPRHLNGRIPRDLETICLKSMEKEPSKRYSTADEVAAELRRFLAGQPIHARPISQVSRFWRLCRRHPVTSSAIGAAVLVALLALVVVSAALAHSIRSLRRESAALAQSEQSLHEALAAVNDLFTTVSENTLLNQPGLQPVREDLLQKALAYYQRFLLQRGNDPAVQDELAAAYFRVGLITVALKSPSDALPEFQTARRMQEQRLAQQPNDPARLKALATTLNALGNLWARQKDYPAARRTYEDAVLVQEKLLAISPADSEYQRLLANSLMNIGSTDYSAALAAADDASLKSGLAKARTQFEEAQAIRLSALERDPNHVKLRRDLGRAYFNLGNLESADQNNSAAATHYEQAAAQFEKLVNEPSSDLDDRRSLAVSCRRAGDLLMHEQQWADARNWYAKALGQLEPLAQQNPDVAEYQADRAGLLISLFQLESGAGRMPDALNALQRARDILEPLAKRFPKVPNYQRDLAVTLREVAKVQWTAGNTQAADKNLNEALRIFAELVRQYPQETEYLDQLDDTKEATPAGLAFKAAERLRQEGFLQKSIVEYSKAIELQPDYYEALWGRALAHTELANRDQAIADFRAVLRLQPSDAPAQINLAFNLRMKGDLNASISAYATAIRLDSTRPRAHYGLGLALAEMGSWDQAITAYQEAIRLNANDFEAYYSLSQAFTKLRMFEKAMNALQNAIHLKPDSADLHNSLAWLLATCPDSRLQDPERAVELAKTAADFAPTDPNIWNTVGTALYRHKKWQDAVVALEKSAQLNPQGTFLGSNAFFLAMSHWQLGNNDQALKCHTRAKQWTENNKASLEKNGRAEELRHFEAECEQLLGTVASK